MEELVQLNEADISYVSDLATRAGDLAAHMREGVEVREKTGPHDLVTEADDELSRLITSELRARFPDETVISEEETEHHHHSPRLARRVWLIDPIDGTDNYVRNDGQYAVMIGLLVDQQPVFGWVYAPAYHTLYYGGPTYGTWRQPGSQSAQRYGPPHDLGGGRAKRVMMGFRDRKTHPWVMELPDVELIKSGSIGIKVAKILDDEADIFVHLSGKLKVWDTAAPVAIALGAGLEVGQLEPCPIVYDLPHIHQSCPVIIGRPGALGWSRSNLVKG